MIELSKKLQKLIIVSIEVDEEEDAYTVFEAVNAKGAKLTLADILKNMIFRKLRPEAGEDDLAQEKWDRILHNLEPIGFNMSKFIRYHWLSKFEFLPESKLYDAIKRKLEIEKSMTWLEFLENLEDDSRRMKKLFDSDPIHFSEVSSGNRISSSLQAISSMNVSQCYVVLLSMFRNISLKKKWVREYEFLEKFCFNYHAIGKQQAVRVEKRYSEYAVEIENIGYSDASDREKSVMLETALRRMHDELTKLCNDFVSQEHFLNRFSEELKYSPSGKKKQLLKYVLLKINAKISGGTGEMTIDPFNTNIEHILPQKPAQWGLDPIQVEDYVDNIGNLTILSKKLNSSIGNKPLGEKLAELEKSEIALTIDLVNMIKENGLQWNRDIIERRGQDLAKVAYRDIWKI